MIESEPSDVSLMGTMKKGDTRALVSLIDRWQTRLLHFVYRYVQNEALARDLVQETFVRIYQARDRFDEKRVFSTWMFGIAANLCRNHYRWLRRHAEAALDSIPEPTESRTPADEVGIHERDRDLARAIGQLPHALKAALLLHYFDGLPYSEIAQIVGCSVRGVESRLYRARKLLYRRLNSGNRTEKKPGNDPDIASEKSPGKRVLNCS